jgi:hypothetical protein
MEGYCTALSGIRILKRRAIPVMARIFKGPSSKLISASIMVKNMTAINSGLYISAYRNKPAAKMIIKFKGETIIVRRYISGIMNYILSLIFLYKIPR